MTKMHEPKAMTEVRTMREKLSKELKDLTPDERFAFLTKGVDEFEKKFGVKLKRQMIDDDDQFPGRKKGVE